MAVGAHYDHLGRGGNGSSLARKEEAGQIHAGADDNASGTAAVLAIAETLAGEPRHRHVMVAFWSGEEIGLIGSSAFVTKPPVAIDQIAAYLNFDMVGRMQDNKLTVQALGTSPAWAKIIEQANVAAGFDLQLQPDPYQPTDVATFNAANVPCLTFFTGTHADYHRPTDTADKINYEDLDRVVDFAAAILRRVEDADPAPQFTKVDQPAQSGGGRAGVRVFTGTIPDYSTEAKGLLLAASSAAARPSRPGLQKGDVIVEIAGQTIANIYDYTYALDVLKIGQPAKVVYMRERAAPGNDADARRAKIVRFEPPCERLEPSGGKGLGVCSCPAKIDYKSFSFGGSHETRQASILARSGLHGMDGAPAPRSGQPTPRARQRPQVPSGRHSVRLANLRLAVHGLPRRDRRYCRGRQPAHRSHPPGQHR